MLKVVKAKGSEKLLGGLQVKAIKDNNFNKVTEVLIHMEDVQWMIDRLEAYKQRCIELNIWE